MYIVFFYYCFTSLRDQFTLETNGIALYQGRKKDMLIRGGENIFPKEIEDVIDKHPSVLESQVCSV